MKAFVVGREEVSYTKKTGENVLAVNLHCVREVPRGMLDKAEGQLVKTFFCSGGLYEYCKKIPLGSEIDVEIESRGKYEMIMEVNIIDNP